MLGDGLARREARDPPDPWLLPTVSSLIGASIAFQPEPLLCKQITKALVGHPQQGQRSGMGFHQVRRNKKPSRVRLSFALELFLMDNII